MKTITWTPNVVVAFIILILISCKEKKPISVSVQQHTNLTLVNLG